MIRALFSTVLILVFCGSVYGSDLDVLIANCDACHGKSGVSSDRDIPIIAGQPSMFIRDNLIAFRANERVCTENEFRHGDTSRPATTMCKVTAALDDADIEAVSKYYESQTFVSAKQPFDESKVAAGAEVQKKGHCDMCHADGGRLSNGKVPILAGQWTPYLEATMHEIKEGTRKVPKIVKVGVQSFSEEELDALLHFYASQQD